MHRDLSNGRKRRIIAILTLLCLTAAGCGAKQRTAAVAEARHIRVVQAETEPQGAPPAPARRRLPYCYTILLSGVDDAGGGSDTNLLARFDAGNRRVDLVSLPRDTLLHTERRSNKLNFAYASGGTEQLRADVEALLGVPVDFAVTVDLKGFAALIDRIGGVDFDVPVDMDYDDPYQDLHIHFVRGSRHLSGREAMEVVRWRRNNDGGGYPDADLGRIATQQAFLAAAARQALRPENAPALAQALFSCVRTDLSAGNLAWLAGEALSIGTEGLRFHTLPGDGAGYYRGESVFVLDPEATLALVNDALNPFDQPIAADEQDILVP